MFSRRKHDPADNSQEPDSPVQPFDVTGFRARVAAGADWNHGAGNLASRVGKGPYHSDHPLHHLAVDANALRCEAHAVADSFPQVSVVARVLDVAADTLSECCEAVGL